MEITNLIKKGIKDPKRAKSVILAKFNSLFVSREYSGIKKNRSDSDDGLYQSSIKNFLSSTKSFNNFKQNPFYQKILEHTSKQAGQDCLDIINTQTPEMLENKLDLFLQNDEIGNPDIYYYDEVGEICPSTLNYIKVASDIKKLFGDKIKGNIAEIGCGYGGQALILDSVFDIDEMILFDLQIVNKLISKYLEHFVLNSSYKVSTLNEAQPKTYNLVVSNFAFSELPKALQIKYIEKVLSRSSHGYLIMNTGKGNHTGESEDDRLSVDDLRSLLPDFEIFEEKPLTSKHNYVIAWGHHGSI